MRLNLGCGADIRDGWVNADRLDLPGVDVVCDLDTVWPWLDGTFVEVEAFDVFEHVDDPLLFMSELWRVLRPGGMAAIHTTDWRSPNAWTDPTHRRACTLRTFDYWVPGTDLYRRYPYANGNVFEKVSAVMDGTELAFVLRKVHA